MKKEDIGDELIRMLQKFAPEVNIEEIDREDSLREQFEVDSLDFGNFLVAVNKKYNIDIPEKDYINFNSISKASDYIMSKLS